MLCGAVSARWFGRASARVADLHVSADCRNLTLAGAGGRSVLVYVGTAISGCQVRAGALPAAGRRWSVCAYITIKTQTAVFQVTGMLSRNHILAAAQVDWLGDRDGVHVRVTLSPGTPANPTNTLAAPPAPWWAVSLPRAGAAAARVACSGPLSSCPLADVGPCNLALPDLDSPAAASLALRPAPPGSVAIASAGGCGAGAQAPEQMSGAQLLYGLKVRV